MTCPRVSKVVLPLAAACAAALAACSVGPQPGAAAWPASVTPAARAWLPLPDPATAPPPGGTGFSASGMDNAKVAVDSKNNVYVAFRDWGANGATVEQLVGDTWTVLGTDGFYSPIDDLSLAIGPDDRPVVAAHDSGSSRIVVLKWDGSTWKTLGPNTGITSDSTQMPTLMAGADGTLFCGFQDTSLGGKAAVLRYDQDSNSWVPLGNPLQPLAGFTPAAAWPLRFALSPASGLWVIFADSNAGSQVSVMNGDPKNGTWQYVETAGFTGSTGQYLQIHAGPDGDPVLGFQHDAIPDLVVLKLHDGKWKTIGTTSLNTGAVAEATFAVGPGGQVYAAFQDPGYANAATVATYTGTGWTLVGPRGFTPGVAGQAALAIDRTGAPILAYQDQANASHISVMSFR